MNPLDGREPALAGGGWIERTASCSCGQLSVTVDGDPEFHGLCSCLACQKESGSAFTYGGYWATAAVLAIRGESGCYRRFAESGQWLDRHFCPRCGCGVYSYAQWAPDMINIAIGNFGDPSFPPPQYAVWNRHKHPWVSIPEGWASFDEQPAADAEGRLVG